MARRKRATVQGNDPAYRSDFTARGFQPLPTVGARAAQTEEAAKPQGGPVAVMPAKEAAPAREETVPAEPKTEGQGGPAGEPETEAKPKPARKKAPSKPVAKAPVTAPTPLPDAGKRQVPLVASAKVEQHERLVALEGKGIAVTDAMALAGRRAVKRFDPVQELVPRQEADRMPTRQSYRSTKRLNAALLDALRAEHDPLGLKSDSAMVIGQFEPLFWSCLDEVIEELDGRF
jgi:hypothetical protein